MSVCPIGKYKGTKIENLEKSYIVFLLGYKDKRKCILPEKQPGWTFRYPEFYGNLLERISQCIRCGSPINKFSENKHLRVLCENCYEKHKNGAGYGKCKYERSNEISPECKFYESVVSILKLDEIKRVNSEGNWNQEKPCKLCENTQYSLGKIRKKYYNICTICYSEYYEKHHKDYNNDGFDENLYLNFVDTLQKKLDNIVISNKTSHSVTSIITKECASLATELNFKCIMEKLARNLVNNMKSVAYDLELCNDKTKFIIEIDRTHNENSIEKMNDSEYKRCIWIRWGKITDDDKSSNNYDVIKIPLKFCDGLWTKVKNPQEYNKLGVLEYF